MKRTRQTLTVLAIMSACVTSCIKEGPCPLTEEGSQVPLSISVKASEGMSTRGIITGTALEDGSVIGVTLCDISGKTYQGETFENIPYRASGSSSGQVWASETPLMVSLTPGTLYACHPYSEEVTTLEEIAVEASSAEQTDWMYAAPVKALSKENCEAEIVLSHALSAVRLSLLRGTYSGEGVVTGASLSGEAVPTAAVLDARSGEMGSFSGEGTAISPGMDAVTLSETAAEVDIIAIPSGATGDLNVTLTIDGKEFTAVIPDVTLEQGKITCCEISVNDGEVRIASVALQAWTQTSAGSQLVQDIHTVTIDGDTEGLSFSNSIDEEGNVTIIAVPYISGDAETRPVTITGSATLTQSVDEETGILTVVLSDIESDVSVVFDGFYLWMTFTHEVTDISSETQIYYRSMTSVDRIKIDGTDVGTGNTYQFGSTGEHVVKIALKDHRIVSGLLMYYLDTVTSASFPEGVEQIGEWAFLGCDNFRQVTLPSTLRSIGYQCFENTALESVVIPDGCSLGYGAFDSCTSLTQVRLPEDMTAIPKYLFSDCSSLTSLEIPEGVKEIGIKAFAATALESISFPDGVSVISDQVCRFCQSLREVRLQAALTAIGTEAFLYCSALERVILADGTVCTSDIIIPEGVTTIGMYGIKTYSESILSITLPSTLTQLVAGSLVNPALEEYVMEQSNPAYDIRNGSVVETATNTLVAGVTSGGVIDASVTAIGAYAFHDSMIGSVDLHSGITQIQDYAFSGAQSASVISRAATPPSLGTMSFNMSRKGGRLKVPEEYLDAYEAQWMIDEVGYLGWSTVGWSITALADGE